MNTTNFPNCSNLFKYRYKRKHPSEMDYVEDNPQMNLINKKFKTDTSKELDYYQVVKIFPASNLNNSNRIHSSNIFRANDISYYDTIMSSNNNTESEKMEQLQMRK